MTERGEEDHDGFGKGKGRDCGCGHIGHRSGRCETKEEKWVFVTKLGCLVKDGKILSLK